MPKEGEPSTPLNTILVVVVAGMCMNKLPSDDLDDDDDQVYVKYCMGTGKQLSSMVYITRRV